jgi:hypothetical protein
MDSKSAEGNLVGVRPPSRHQDYKGFMHNSVSSTRSTLSPLSTVSLHAPNMHPAPNMHRYMHQMHNQTRLRVRGISF